MNETDRYLTDENLRVFTMKNYFVDSRHRNAKTHWNWAAFFLTPFWLFYRKMYLLGFVYLIFTMLVQELIPSSLAVFIINWTVSIFIGLFGNTIYIKHAEKKITRICETHDDDFARIQEFYEQGGTTLRASILIPLGVGMIHAVVVYSFL
ncbi:DUF2628 domain-containing protein [Paenibacillus sp. P96]|uniref:DUF2628 domain-containing protein n=1 Tax=Paenibacillus zeirhizosphaerae TaxID=2987519 RepID=A0ABT9FVZ8_9BACL|nr:DUF2628 domain-containing protein [Paenibacillus sp. P96]MDP4098908.1 DUF2628 domain-containing protein [Paenibacillus sp. P96]